MIKSLQGELFAPEPFADLQPSFRDTGETPMLPSARRHAAPKARRGVFPSRNVQLQCPEGVAGFSPGF